MTARTFGPDYSGLPDPEVQPEIYANIPAKRLIAWLVDMAVIGGLTVLVIPLTAFTGLFFIPALYLVLGFVYRVVTIANGSATLGMRLLAIEFRRSTGERFDGLYALLHTAGYTVSLAMPLLQVFSVALMVSTPRAQGLTDHILATAAVNRYR
jgi:uncharacterized RDD family membrane protein YckC